MQVAKWGNSLAIGFPHKIVVEGLELKKEGDHVEIRIAAGRAFEVARENSSRERALTLIQRKQEEENAESGIQKKCE